MPDTPGSPPSGSTRPGPPSSFASVVEEVAARRQEFAEKRHVPRDMVQRFKELGLYRAATPRCFGGDALPPGEFLRAIERIAEADGSAAWVASFGVSGVYLAALPHETQAKIYAQGPDLVFAGGLFPVQPVEQAAGGFTVTGRWKFASGCMAAELLGVGIGGGADGRPRTAVLSPNQVEIVESWESVGLEGTGSHDLAVHGAFVPEEWTFVRGGAATVDEPLYRYPSLAYAAQVLAVVNVGIARAALDHVIRLGSGQGGITGAPKPADRAYFRIGVAKAEAELRSARAFFYEVTDEAYASSLAGDTVTPRQAGMLRLAAAHVARAGFEAVRAAYNLSGIAATHPDHPLQHRLRDASVVTQHAFLTEAMYDGAGAVLTGVDPFPGFP